MIALDAESKIVHGGKRPQAGVQETVGVPARGIKKKRTDVLPASAGSTYGLITTAPGLLGAKRSSIVHDTN